MGDWQHDALAVDLARWLKGNGNHWVWLNSALGEWKGPRPDIMAYRRYRYEAPVIRAFECKVSRADLLSDLNKEKWRSYLEHCQSVTFIMPSGMAKKEEIPVECGVMFRSGRGWRTERQPQSIGTGASTVAMAKLLTMHPLRVADGTEERSRYTLDNWRNQAGDAFLRDCGKRHGAEVARYMAAIIRGSDPVAHAKKRAGEIIDEAKRDADRLREAIKPALDALGLDADTNDWLLAQKIRQRVSELSKDGQISAIREALRKCSQAVADAERVISIPKDQAA